MTQNSFDQQERETLLKAMQTIHSQLYPRDFKDSPEKRIAIQLRENYFQLKGEYADRIPRMALSRCPFSGKDLKRSFDPFGLDGPWWHKTLDVEIEEPRPLETFQALLGSVNFQDRKPIETVVEVRPGPGVPFIVPRLLDLPGMVAVISRIVLDTGDISYPIGYFSQEEIDPADLHQPWCRSNFWYETDNGDAAWSISCDGFDYDLQPYLDDGRLKWTDLSDPKGPVLGSTDGPCPFIGMTGARELQQVVRGRVGLIGQPNE